jgi:hypothetical protein
LTIRDAELKEKHFRNTKSSNFSNFKFSNILKPRRRNKEQGTRNAERVNLRRAYFYPSVAKAPTQKYQDYRAAQDESKSRASDIL